MAQLSPALQPGGKSLSVAFDPESKLAEFSCFRCYRILEFLYNLFRLTVDETCSAFFSEIHYENSRLWLTCVKAWWLKQGRVSGASVRNSAHGKGHEEGGLAYAKA